MSDYLYMWMEVANKRNLEVKKVEKELARVYSRACDRYMKELSKVKPGSLDEAWLMNKAKAAAKELERMGQVQADIISKSSQNIINEVNKTTEKYFNTAAERAGLPKDLFNGMYTSMNSKVLRELIAGNVYKDGKGLSSRVWSNLDKVGKDIHNVVLDSLADKNSVYKTADILGKYLKPGSENVGKYPKIGGKRVEYSSYRLANATITHSYQMALDRVNKTNPFMQGIQWVGGHSARSCQICKDRDGKIYGAPFNKDVMTTEPLPLDHPNGFCNNIPYIPDSLDKIGERLGDWVKGKKDPELDKWFKEHGDKYTSVGDIQKATNEKPVKDKAPKEETPSNVRDDKWFDETFKKMKKEVGKEHWENIRSHMKKAPEHIQDFWAKGAKKFKYLGTDGNAAYFSLQKGGIAMDLVKDKHNPRNPYTTFFHEYGHLIDSKATRGKALSDSMAFYNKIEKDYEKLLKKSSSAKMWKENPELAKRQAESHLNRKLRDEKDYISAVSDIIGGLTNNQVMGKWGHSVEYWNRWNKKAEITSEMFAHMSSCYANEDNYRIMKEYFPGALDWFEKKAHKLISK